MLTEDNLYDLRTAMFDYIQAYGLPTEPAALEWFQLAAKEGTTPEDAFTPMYDAYSRGLGFTVDEWMNWTYNIQDISILPDSGGGVWINFDFDFESDDGQYEGSRGGRGHI